jgi:2-methylisocitrate lyase-like PEP mutase family enzyme
VFLAAVGVPHGRLDDVLARATTYAEAGADSLFVSGLVDLPAIAELTTASPLPVNVMARPGLIRRGAGGRGFSEFWCRRGCRLWWCRRG